VAVRSSPRRHHFCEHHHNSGFTDAQQAIDSTEGFAIVLAGAKAFLEHDIVLNLAPDRFPDGLPSR